MGKPRGIVVIQPCRFGTVEKRELPEAVLGGRNLEESTIALEAPVLFPLCLFQPSLVGYRHVVVLPKSAPRWLSAGKTPRREGWLLGQDPDPRMTSNQVFHMRGKIPTTSSSLSFPPKKESQHSYLQRFITAWKRFRSGVREERKGAEQLEDKNLAPPLRAPPPQERILGSIPGIKAQTKRNKAALASPSSRHPG